MYQVKGYFLLRNTAPKTPTIISPTSPSKITVPQNIQKLLNMNCKSSNIPISSLLRFPKSIIDKVLRRICTVCLSYYRPVSNGMVFQPQSDLHRYTGDVPFPALRTTHFILRFPTGKLPYQIPLFLSVQFDVCWQERITTTHMDRLGIEPNSIPAVFHCDSLQDGIEP